MGSRESEKFRTADVISPFSIRNVPSRVIPVSVRSDGLTGRIYQKFVTRIPRCVVRMRSSTRVPMGRSPDK